MTEDFQLSKADYIIQQLNVQTAKKVCFLLAFSFIIYHSIIHYKYGNDSCKWLLQDLGRFKGDKEWQVRIVFYLLQSNLHKRMPEIGEKPFN